MPDEAPEPREVPDGSASPSKTPMKAAEGKVDGTEDDDQTPVPDLGEAIAPFLDPQMMRDAQWQNDQMKTFHKAVKPRWDKFLVEILSNSRAIKADLEAMKREVAALKTELEAHEEVGADLD